MEQRSGLLDLFLITPNGFVIILLNDVQIIIRQGDSYEKIKQGQRKDHESNNQPYY